MDPDLLIAPEMLNMQTSIPTGGRYIRYTNGLRIKRKTAENPIAVRDRAEAEAEKNALVSAMIEKM